MDHRLQPRIAVNPVCQARFRLGATACRNITVSNLASDGCCLLLPGFLAADLAALPVLEDWRLTGPDLPPGEIKARVVWVRGHGTSAGPSLKAGVRFSQIPPRYHQALGEFIRYVGRTGIPAIDYRGMPA
jgi:c-di-GMP-binding flagellar brake protein YcgR